MASPASPEASEIRRRGRRRLIGAIAIAVLLVVFVPMILDSQPRGPRNPPALEIPAKDTAPALAPPALAVKPATVPAAQPSEHQASPAVPPKQTAPSTTAAPSTAPAKPSKPAVPAQAAAPRSRASRCRWARSGMRTS